MPLHPQLIEAFAHKLPRPPLWLLPPKLFRVLFNWQMRKIESPPEPVAKVQNLRIPGPAGPIPVRVYTPAGVPLLPMLVYFHGGGMVLGTLDTWETPCRALANGSGAIVLSVEYRLAPEHKFPAAHEDAYAATRWAAENAASFGGDPRRVAVGGDSAGGTLAAAVCLMARDRGGPAICFQLLVYPFLGADFNTRSYHECGEGYVLTKELVEYFLKKYWGEKSDADHPYDVPLAAKDLRGLPPALILTAEYDPLRDDGTAYAARLREAGVEATLWDQPGLTHGFWNMGAILDETHVIRAKTAAFLRAAFDRCSSATPAR